MIAGGLGSVTAGAARSAFPSPLGERVASAASRERGVGLAQAKKLRSDMTDAERRLWYRLRAHRFGATRATLSPRGEGNERATPP